MNRSGWNLSLRRLVLAALLLAWQGSAVLAQEALSPDNMMCPNARLWGAGLVTNICWTCLFPIRLFGRAQFGDDSAPADATDEMLCSCPGNGGISERGFTVGMWATAGILELVRKPYCSPTLNGTTIRDSFRLWGMRDGSDGSTSSNQFYNLHYFSFPLYEILDLLIGLECNAGGYTDLDLLYPSELDPTWGEPELGPITTPEAVVAANPLLQATCPVDCTAATFSRPSNRMWWCAGCWGNLYPFTGGVPAGGSGPRVTSLLATRGMASFHRRGMAWRTVGDDALCGGEIYPMIPKDQYKMSMLYPIPEANNVPRTPGAATAAATGNADIDNFEYTQGCCHNIGVPTYLWGEWRNIPGVGEDYVYVLWRWTDCCMR